MVALSISRSNGDFPPMRTPCAVSVTIPTFRRPEMLHMALASTLEQTLREIEVIVSDNGADDETAAVVASFDDPRVTYAPLEENIGLYKNMTRCLRLGTAPYVTILGDDDLLDPRSLERKLERIERDPRIAVVSTAHSVIDADGHVVADDVNWCLAESDWELDGESFIRRSIGSGVFFHMSTVLMRRTAVAHEEFEPVGGYTDLGIWLRAAARGAHFAYIHEPLTAIREHGRSASTVQGLHAHPELGRGAGEVDTQTFEQVRQMQFVRRQFLEREGAEIPHRRALWASARRDARKRLARLVVKDALIHHSLGRTVRQIREASRIDRAFPYTSWSFVAILVAVGGRPAWHAISFVAAPARGYWGR